MAYNLAELKTNLAKPPRICIYGGEGVGKTTFACKSHKPLVLNLEDGIPPALSSIPNIRAKTYAECMDVLEALYTQDHDFKTVVVDSLDVIEEMITHKVCAENRYTDISKGAYGAGYQARTAVWANFFKCLDLLRDKGLTIILIAHAAVVKVADPLLPEYDKQSIHLYKTESLRVVEWCDVVGYALVKTYTTNDGKRNLATTAGEHVILTHSNPAYTAKTRYEMPDEIPMVWSEFAKYLYPTEQTANTKKTNKEN